MNKKNLRKSMLMFAVATLFLAGAIYVLFFMK
jgi:hypothetical protein